MYIRNTYNILYTQCNYLAFGVPAILWRSVFGTPEPPANFTLSHSNTPRRMALVVFVLLQMKSNAPFIHRNREMQACSVDSAQRTRFPSERQFIRPTKRKFSLLT